MALTIESGAGKTDADSYASVSDADAYNTDWRDSASWTGLAQEAKERALRRGTRFVDTFTYKGVRQNQDQALDWPRDRVGLVDGQDILPGTIPTRIKRAAMEAAIKDAEGETLFPDHDGGTIESKSQQVGNLSESTTYANPAQPSKQFEAIRKLVKPFTDSGNRLTRTIA